MYTHMLCDTPDALHSVNMCHVCTSMFEYASHMCTSIEATMQLHACIQAFLAKAKAQSSKFHVGISCVCIHMQTHAHTHLPVFLAEAKVLVQAVTHIVAIQAILCMHVQIRKDIFSCSSARLDLSGTNAGMHQCPSAQGINTKKQICPSHRHCAVQHSELTARMPRSMSFFSSTEETVDLPLPLTARIQQKGHFSVEFLHHGGM
jgi:hypothetical protein